jgi:hypothetical protein
LALAGVLALAVAAIALVVALSGGGSGDGGQGSLEYIRFTTSAFSVDVPEGWKLDENERQLDPTTTRTSFNSPSQQMRVEVVQESDLPPATRANEAQTERSQDRGYSRITISPQTVNGREARLFGYEIDDKTLDYQPSTAYTYFFNAGQSGWRTRAVGARADVRDDTVLAIATRMAGSLEPR